MDVEDRSGERTGRGVQGREGQVQGVTSVLRQDLFPDEVSGETYGDK